MVNGGVLRLAGIKAACVALAWAASEAWAQPAWAGDVAGGAPWLVSAAPAIAFATLVSAATLCACFAAFAFGQRRFGARLEATLADMEYTSTQMRNAAGAGREQAAAVTRLAAASADAEMQLRSWVDSAQASQSQAAALAGKCTRLADALPDLLRDALASARGGMDFEGLVLRLEDVAGALQDGVQRAAAAAAAQAAQQAEAARLIGRCEQAVAALPDSVGETLVTIQARGQAAIDAASGRLAGNASALEAAAEAMRGVAQEVCAAAGEAGMRAHASTLARQQEEETLEAAAGRLRESGALIDSAAEAIGAQTLRLDEAVGRADAVSRSLPAVTAHLAEGAAAIRREALAALEDAGARAAPALGMDGVVLDAAERLRRDAEWARAVLAQGMDGLLSAASLLRRDAADAEAAATRREAECDAAQTGRLARVEEAALAAVARVGDAAARKGPADHAAAAAALGGTLAQLSAAVAAVEQASAWLNRSAEEGVPADMRRAAAQIAGATVKLAEASARQEQAAAHVARAASAVSASVQPIGVLREA